VLRARPTSGRPWAPRSWGSSYLPARPWRRLPQRMSPGRHVSVTDLPTGRPGRDATHAVDPSVASDQPGSCTPQTSRDWMTHACTGRTTPDARARWGSTRHDPPLGSTVPGRGGSGPGRVRTCPGAVHHPSSSWPCREPPRRAEPEDPGRRLEAAVNRARRLGPRSARSGPPGCALGTHTCRTVGGWPVLPRFTPTSPRARGSPP